MPVSYLVNKWMDLLSSYKFKAKLENSLSQSLWLLDSDLPGTIPKIFETGCKQNWGELKDGGFKCKLSNSKNKKFISVLGFPHDIWTKNVEFR